MVSNSDRLDSKKRPDAETNIIDAIQLGGGGQIDPPGRKKLSSLNGFRYVSAIY